MTEQHQLIAYLATLGAIVALVAIGAALAATGKSLEAVGVAAAVTGLIGVIKLPASRLPAANVERAETVNQAPGAAS
jgi:hypothetical protein